jgi:uncharacterized membrane protein
MSLLFIGLIVLAAIVYRLSVRVGALEREIEWLRDARTADDAPRATEAEPAPAVVAKMPAAESPPEHVRRNPALADMVGDASEIQTQPSHATADMGGLFEQLVGGRLLIWIGGVALAVAGLLLVRYSIEIGLVTPGVRMALAALFGIVLIAGAEFARWRPGKVVDPRVAQALAGAGVLILYASAYGSQILYGLISAETALLLMTAITVGALVLSLRHGAPTAVMGLAGGFATPLLVGSPSETSVPLLTYLALLDIALFAIASRRGWTWLAAGALVLSLAWTAVLVTLSPGQALPAGLFVVVVSVAGSLLRAGKGWEIDFLRPAAIGLVELALLVGRLDLGLPAWGLFGVLAVASFPLSARKAEYRLLPALAIVLALLLLLIRAIDAQDPMLALIAAGITLIFAGGAVPGALRGSNRRVHVAVASFAFAGPALILRVAHEALLARPAWGLLFALLAAGPFLLAWTRPNNGGKIDGARVTAASVCAFLLALACLDLLHADLVGSGWLLIALAAALAARRTEDRGVVALAGVAAAAGIAWSACRIPLLWSSLGESLAGDPPLLGDLPPLGQGLLVLVPASAILLAAARLASDAPALWRKAALSAGGIFGAMAFYLVYKQLFALSSPQDFVARGFAERMVLTQMLFAAGWAACHQRLAVPGFGLEARRAAGLFLTGLAAARLVWFDMLFHNPVLVDQAVGPWPIVNLIVPAYLGSALWLYRARRVAEDQIRSGLWLALALLSLVLGVMLLVRQAFHGSVLAGAEIGQFESFVYSLAALLLSVVLILGGIRIADKALRLAGLALLTLTICKVFLFDASALEGVLRILSFLGLGSLIAIGKLYGTVLRAEAGRRTAAPDSPASREA